MAIIKVVKAGTTQASLKAALNYISDEQKITLPTGEKLMTNLNCWGDLQNVYETMIATKAMFRKVRDNRHSEMYKHFQQGFKPGEVQPKTAHEIGIKWADNNFGQAGFEVCICTHLDKDHIHNHFIINSVNALTGKTLEIHANKTLEILKASSDDLCRAYHLSVINRNYHMRDDAKPVYSMKKRYSVLRDEFKQLSWQKDFFDKVKSAIEKSQNKGFNYFVESLAKQRIEVDYKRLNNDLIFRNLVTGKCISDKILNETFIEEIPDKFFLRSDIESLVGTIPAYEIDRDEILSEKKQGFYKLIENLIDIVDNMPAMQTKEEFYAYLAKQNWSVQDTPTGRAFYANEAKRLFYDTTIYKVLHEHKYCLAYIEQQLK